MENIYKNWIIELKQKISNAQIKASLTVNKQLILLYWDIGKSIAEKQNSQKWGSKIIEQVAKDLKMELPNTTGFSRTNLFSMRQFYLFYNNVVVEMATTKKSYLSENQQDIIVHQVGGQLKKAPRKKQTTFLSIENSELCQIPWRHHIVIMAKCKTAKEAFFYIRETIKNNWSRNILEIQLDSSLIKRQGKAQNNFDSTLSKIQGDLAKETIKDPYKFGFLALETDVQELQLEKMLTDNITQFLLELGKGFAYVGRQFPLQIGNKERRLDLLFYHLKMHCYVVVDLKITEFEPEFVGKMNYYLTAVDKLIKSSTDNPSIGIILCKSKEKIEVEFALQDISKPMGISEFTFTQLPMEMQNNMPSIEELEKEFV